MLSTFLESKFTQLQICLTVLSSTHATGLFMRMLLEIVKSLSETQASCVCTIYPLSCFCSTASISPSSVPCLAAFHTSFFSFLDTLHQTFYPQIYRIHLHEVFSGYFCLFPFFYNSLSKPCDNQASVFF